MTLDAWMELAHRQMVWLEAHRTPALDAVFLAFTALGSEAFLLLFVALGYWLGDRRTFLRASMMLLIAGLLNTWLKGVVLEPRPEVTTVHPAGGWSFPSGHAQVAGALWGDLAWSARSRPPVAVALLLVAVLVAVSRPYLGVHYPHDVAFGLGLGLLQVGARVGLEKRGLRLPTEGRGLLLRFAIGAALLLLVVGVFHPTVRELGARLSGALTGLLVGGGLAADAGWLEPRREDRRARLALLGVGLAGLLLVWLGLKAGLSAIGLGEALLAAYARYVLVGAWVAVGSLAIRGLVLSAPSR